VRLDVTLVDRFGGELALDHDVRLGEASRNVPERELHALGHVRRLRRLRLDTDRVHVVVKQRRAGLHRLGNVQHVRQHLVLDCDQLQRLGGDRFAHRCYRSDRVPFVERLLARHHVARHVAVVDHHLAGRNECGRQIGEIGRGDHRLHAGQRQRLRRVDRLDAGVRMGAAQHLADQHVRHTDVGAEPGAAGDFVDPVGAQWPRSHDLEQPLVQSLHRNVVHPQLLRISPAASSTARTILS
jgi:hypothetical protein